MLPPVTCGLALKMDSRLYPRWMSSSPGCNGHVHSLSIEHKFVDCTNFFTVMTQFSTALWMQLDAWRGLWHFLCSTTPVARPPSSFWVKGSRRGRNGTFHSSSVLLPERPPRAHVMHYRYVGWSEPLMM